MIWEFQENRETRQRGKTSCGVLKPFGNNKKSRNPGVHSWNAWHQGGNKGVERKLPWEQRRALRKCKAAAKGFSGGRCCGAFWNKSRFRSR